VSRVGSAAQIKAMKQVAGTMKLDLAQFRELQAFAQFSSDLDDKTKAQLERGLRVNEILKQGWDKPLSVAEQVMVVYAAVHGMLDKIELEKIQTWEQLYLEYLHATQQDLLDSITAAQKITEEIEPKIVKVIETFNDLHKDLRLSED
jgi:F-type H+/Na+-transporting ATPase subunit alpha